MKVLFDANVIIDIFKQNEAHSLDSYAAFDICGMRKWDICIAATQVPDLEYLFLARKIVSRENVATTLKQIFECFEIIDVAECDCILAFEKQTRNEGSTEGSTEGLTEGPAGGPAGGSTHVLDLEDGIIYSSALRHDVDTILSWDRKFAEVVSDSQGNVPVMTPSVFVNTYKPANVIYDVINMTE